MCSASENAPPARTVANIHQRPSCSNSVASLAAMPESSVASLTHRPGTFHGAMRIDRPGRDASGTIRHRRDAAKTNG